MNILIVDAQGGGIGKQLVSHIKEKYPNECITAIGTNSIATSAMLKAGADQAATGENAVRVACKSADIIVGPIGLIIADAMIGEITPAIAQYISQSSATRILLPFNNCNTFIAGVNSFNTGELIASAIKRLSQLLD